DEDKSWFAFALQKCAELSLLSQALNNTDATALEAWSAPVHARAHSRRVHKAAVGQRLQAMTPQHSERQSAYPVRAVL
ncbi:5-methyltetrahydropteroyltriglutamate--homocysteine S-methyltransferase, partial [Pantoea agglomerans]